MNEKILVNDIPVFETSEFQALAGDVNVGISEYNLAFTTKDAKIAIDFIQFFARTTICPLRTIE